MPAAKRRSCAAWNARAVMPSACGISANVLGRVAAAWRGQTWRPCGRHRVEAFEVALIGGAVRRGLVRSAGGALHDEAAIFPLQRHLLAGRAVVRFLHLEHAAGAAVLACTVSRCRRARVAFCQSMLPPRPVPLVMPDRLGWSRSRTAQSGLLGELAEEADKGAGVTRSFWLPPNVAAMLSTTIKAGRMSTAAVASDLEQAASAPWSRQGRATASRQLSGLAKWKCSPSISSGSRPRFRRRGTAAGAFRRSGSSPLKKDHGPVLEVVPSQSPRPRQPRQRAAAPAWSCRHRRRLRGS